MKKEIRLFGIKIYEMRSELGTLSNPSAELITTLGSNRTDSGVDVNSRSVLTLTAIWRAVNILSGTIASLPVHVYTKQDDGSRSELPGHVVSSVMKNPNTVQTGFIFRESMMAVLLLWGNAYAVIRRNERGIIEELIWVHASDVNVFRGTDSKIYYQVFVDGRAYTVASKDMLHFPGLSFDGVKGYSPISVMRESMGLGLAAQKFGARFFGSGANMDGVIEVPSTLNDEVYKRLRDSWDEKYHGLEKSHKTAILEGGSTYKRIGIPPEEAQFLQTRQFQVAEVARMFGVQPHLLMDLDRATNNNIEHQGIEFVMFTLTPWISRLEAEMNRKLFDSDDRPRHYVEFNLSGLLRGDSKSRSEYYKAMFSIGAMSPNRIRQLENEPGYDGGDEHFAQAGYMPITQLAEYHKSKISKHEEPKQP